MFEDDVKGFLAIQLGIALEKVVRCGLRFGRKQWFEDVVLQEFLEARGAPLIRGILETINPAESARVREMDERVIWRIYWGFRSSLEDNPTDSAVIIFEVLGVLDSDPSLASAFI